MKRAVIWLFGVFGLGVSPFLVRGAEATADNRVDFRYSLPWWQSAICLPDDRDKILVGKEGELLLDFGQGGFRGFKICLQPEIAGGAKWVRQQTSRRGRRSCKPGRRPPASRCWKRRSWLPRCPAAQPADAVRRIVVLVTLRNRTGAKAVCRPALRIQSVAAGAILREDGIVTVGQQTRIAASEEVQAWEAKPKADARCYWRR